DTVLIDPRAGHAVEPLRDIAPLYRDSGRSSFGDPESLAAVAEAILSDFVTVAEDREEDLAVKQAGLVESDDAIAVGDKRDLIDRPELDQGNAAAGLLVDDLDSEGARTRLRLRALAAMGGFIDFSILCRQRCRDADNGPDQHDPDTTIRHDKRFS